MRAVTEPAPADGSTGGTAPRIARTSGDVRIQLALSIAAIVACWSTVRPLGLAGVNGVVLVLLILNSIFVLSRHLPIGIIPTKADLPLLCCWAVLASALLSLRSLGTAAAFAYFVSGHAGYRLRPPTATAAALLTGALSAIGLRIAEIRHIPGWPWALGLTVSLPVFIGMTNRSRDLVVASALAAAQSAQRAAESEARAQTLAERARISRDIHDVLAHSLSGVSMQLELSEMLLEGGDAERAREAIGKAHSMVREGMVEARRAVTALRIAVLPLAETLGAQFWGSAEVEVVGEPRELPTEVSQTLIRAAQEALTNVRRHAPGAHLEVHLEYRAAQVELQVSNGPAADVLPSRAAAAGSGMGLVGMRERAALLAGWVEAGPIVPDSAAMNDNALAGGWRVRIVLPAEPGE